MTPPAAKSRWPSRLYPGLAILACVLGLLAARAAWRGIFAPPDIRPLAEKLSAMYVIQKYPAISRTEDFIGFLHTTERGVGVFIQDRRANTEQKLCEVLDVDYKASGAWTFGWSPEDETFAYSWDRTIHFFEKDGREGSGNIDGITNHFESFVWLTPDRCAYLDDLPRLALLERAKGRWETAKFLEVATTNGYPRSLQALDDHTVAWHTDSALWQTDLGSGETKLVYANRSRRFDDICYSKGADAYLLVASTNKGRACFLLQVSNSPAGLSVRELVQKPSIRDARWINNGGGYVYLSQRGDEISLNGKTQMEEAERVIFRARHLSLLHDDERDSLVYGIGAAASEPFAVWRYDVVSGEARRVLAPDGEAKFPFRPVVSQTAPYGNRNSAQFEFVPPPNYRRDKKYPLAIGLGGYEWSPIAHAIYGQCLANGGAYVAFVNYRWNQRQPETVYAHTNNVMAVYRQLSANPNIDTNRVYLFGFSAGTLVISELLKQYPGQWRGVMLFNPSFLPEPQAGMTQRVLATSESGDERFRRYQEELAKVGIPFEWYLHEDTQHVPRSQAAMYERAVWMAETVFEK